MSRIKPVLSRSNAPLLYQQYTQIQKPNTPLVSALAMNKLAHVKNTEYRDSTAGHRIHPAADRADVDTSRLPFQHTNTLHANQNDRDKKIDTEYLSRKANLGSMIQLLQIKVPGMLTKLLPKEIISPDIMLKILPNQLPKLPVFKGYLVYSSTLTAIQKILLLFYLNPNSKIHINNIKIIEPTNSMSSDELINLSIDNNEVENMAAPHQDTSTYTTKIKIKWRTCLSGCEDLKDKNTTAAKWGSYRIDYFDWTKLLNSSNPLHTVNLLEAKKTLEGLAKKLDPLSSDYHNTNTNGTAVNVGRVLSGVFIFELDSKNEKIVVFTIDNLDILESKEMNYTDGCIAA